MKTVNLPGLALQAGDHPANQQDLNKSPLNAPGPSQQ